MARIVDTLVVGLPVVLIARATLPQITAEVVTSVGLSGLLLLYESVQLALWGRTIGKRLTGIAVVPAEPEGSQPRAGGGLGVRRALMRSAMYALPIAARPLPVLGAVAGAFWVANVAMLMDRSRRRALHDHAARTVVVRSGL